MTQPPVTPPLPQSSARRTFLWCLRVAALTLYTGLWLAPNIATAAVVGKDYIEIKPAQPGGSQGKIEVRAFFWYGCPHCFQFEPEVAAWTKTLPRDVVFIHQPAVLGDSWMNLTQAYYALDALGEIPRLHARLFNAIHLDGKNLNRPESFLAWAATQGVDRARLEAAYKSFTVFNQASRARQISRDYGLDGVPALTINGKYLISPSMVGSYAGVLQVADELIARERKARR